jgi:hypothetical protein
LDFDSGTTEWRHGRLQLQPRLLLGCSAILMMHFAAAGWGLLLLVMPRQATGGDAIRRWVAVAIALLILWAINRGSVVFLSRAPHLYRGYERLHWFGYVPALVAAASFFLAVRETSRRILRRWMSSRRARFVVDLAAMTLLTMHLGEQAWHLARGQPTLMRSFPPLHSLFDFERYDEREPVRAERVEAMFAPSDGPVPRWPTYLRPDDRVLLLTRYWPPDSDSPLYWELRQAVWWPELYGEAYALFVWGENWLTDWRHYYDAMDRRLSPELDSWIVSRQITVIVDDRSGAAEFVDQLASRINRQATRVAPFAWRLSEAP